MHVPTPPWTRPLIASAVIGYPRGSSLVALRKSPAETELRALLDALQSVAPDDETQCADWSAHDLLAHLAAGTREMAELLEDPRPRATRDFVEREKPYRDMKDQQLRRAFVVEGLRLVAGIEKRHEPVLFTGAVLTVDQIVMHARSELILHRFDLTGGDLIDRIALADPAVTEHALSVVAHMDAGVLPPAGAAVGDDPAARALAIWGRRPPADWVASVS